MRKNGASKLHPIVGEVEAYCKRAGLAESYVGRLAVSNSLFTKRLREGKRSWPETIARFRLWMAENPRD